jgi:hypothetical protein
MNTSIPRLLTALFAAGTLAHAAEIPDGFYSGSEDGSGQAVADPNRPGQHLGKKQSLQVTQAEIFSQDNANTQFVLTVTTPHDTGQAKATEVLAIGGKLYPRNGWGSDQQKESLDFPISGADNAKGVAGYFHVPIAYRMHPGYNMSVSFIPAKPEFEVGDEVKVTLRIQNVGSNAFSFQQGGMNRAERDQQYTFVARFEDKQVEDIGTTMNFGGLSGDRVVKPGETFTDTIVLNKWFIFDKPGQYNVLGSYFMAFKKVNEGNAFVSWWPIWVDYATAPFSVNMVPAKPR